jgi:hypothetical protein
MRSNPRQSPPLDVGGLEPEAHLHEQASVEY